MKALLLICSLTLLTVCADIWTIHNFIQDPEKFAAENVVSCMADQQNGPGYTGQPIFIDEYGGVKWRVVKSDSESGEI